MSNLSLKSSQLLENYRDSNISDKEKINLCLHELGKHKSSIVNMEMQIAEKTSIIKGWPMTTKFETPEETYDDVTSKLFKGLGINPDGEIMIESITRLGHLDDKMRNVPNVRIRFQRPCDRAAFVRALPKLKDLKEFDKVTITNDTPQVMSSVI